MPQTSRITDIGVGSCCCHPPIPCISMSGTLVTGAGTHLVENQPVSRIGDVVLGFCGHVGVMISGSPTKFSEGSQTVRVGDQFSGCFTGTLVTGASTQIS